MTVKGLSYLSRYDKHDQNVTKKFDLKQNY